MTTVDRAETIANSSNGQTAMSSSSEYDTEGNLKSECNKDHQSKNIMDKRANGVHGENDEYSIDKICKPQSFIRINVSEVEPSRTKPLHVVDTWEEITKRDRPLSNETTVEVIDHCVAMLGERICEASSNRYFRESLKAFGRTLSRFRNSEIILGKRIASGSFADIYRVRSFRREEENSCSRINQPNADAIIKENKPEDYVVKVLRKNLLFKPALFKTAAADFITEGTLLASFDHPHILSIRGRSINGVEGFSSGKRDSVFFVLERMDGDLTHKIEEWKKLMSQHGRFAKGRRNLNTLILCERLDLCSNLAAALAYLHERNVIHRDVGLANVGISVGGGKVKLLDFGLAKVLPPSTHENERFLLTGNTGSIR